MTRLAVNGIELEVTDEGQGEAVLLLHGFPDSSALWRHQRPALLAAGYRVITPDLRGFGESSRPADIAAYRVTELLADISGLLDTLAVTRVHVVSHDWGASLGWLLAAQQPQRVASFTALSVGHPQAFYGAGMAQRARSWYMLLFQFEQLAERILAADDWAFLRDFSGHHAECERWVKDLARPGALTAALNWYRANAHPAQTFRKLAFPRVAVRTLGLFGSADPYLEEAQMVASGAYVDAPWRYQRLEGAGHWLPLDRPQAVTALLLEWLAG